MKEITLKFSNWRQLWNFHHSIKPTHYKIMFDCNEVTALLTDAEINVAVAAYMAIVKAQPSCKA